MCTRPMYITRSTVAAAAYRTEFGLQSRKGVCVPCGHCAECLAKRQNDVMIRAYRQAEKSRSAHFITFTYREEDLPIATSLWRADYDTGEMVCMAEPTIVERYHVVGRGKNRQQIPNERYSILRAGVVNCEQRPRSFMLPAFRDKEGNSVLPDGDYYVIGVGSLNSRDIRLVIKNWRVKCSRDSRYDSVPEDFAYMLVGEYGQHNTMRPHYHMFTFNLTNDQADLLASMWPYGDVQVKQVNAVNQDGSNGYQNVARYIAKYSTKGKYDSKALVSRYVVSNRICASVGFGTSDFSDDSRNWLLARDVVDYDPDSIESVRSLSPDQRELICSTIKRRLTFDIPILHRNVRGQLEPTVVHYSMPVSLQRKIFNIKRNSQLGYETCSPIRYLYADYVRSLVLETDNREFKEFASNLGTEDLSVACAEYESYKARALADREKMRDTRHKQFYQQSKF